MRRIDRSATFRTAFSPALLLAAAAGLCFPLCSAAAHAALADAAQAADPTVRICLARDFSDSPKLFVSRAGGQYRIAAAAGSGLWLDAASSKQVASIDAGGLVEFQYSSDATRDPIEKTDNTHFIYRLAEGQSVLLTPGDAGSDADSDSDSAPESFCLQTSSQHSPHHFRGALQITALAGGTLRVIDSVPLEQYLKGVIGPEIGEAAPLEALKAQAIAARTYTIKNLGKLALIGADLDDTNRCQNYLGVDAENWRCRTAVEQTAGEVLTYQDSLIDAVYATDCGGMTAEGDEPYLKAVADPECAGAAPWTVTVSTSALQAALARIGVSGLDAIDSVAVHERDASGRVATLTCTNEATGASNDVSALLVRKALGYDLLRSTLFTVSMTSDPPSAPTADSASASLAATVPSSAHRRQRSRSCDAPAADMITFTGKGWGHGLGMCQHGAVEMAKSDAATSDQILHHFYNGVQITTLTSDLVNGDEAKAAPSAWSAAGLAAFASSHHHASSAHSAAASSSSSASIQPARRTYGGGEPDGASDAKPDTDNRVTAATFPRRGF